MDEEYRRNTEKVMAHLAQKAMSERTIRQYRECFDLLGSHLRESGLGYSEYAAWEWLDGVAEARHRLVGSWSWQSHLRPQTGHLSCSLLCGLTLTTIESPSIATPRTTAFTSDRTCRRIFAMRQPSLGSDTFGEVESYGKTAPNGPARGRSPWTCLISTRELGKGVVAHPHKLPKSHIYSIKYSRSTMPGEGWPVVPFPHTVAASVCGLGKVQGGATADDPATCNPSPCRPLP